MMDSTFSPSVAFVTTEPCLSLARSVFLPYRPRSGLMGRATARDPHMAEIDAAAAWLARRTAAGPNPTESGDLPREANGAAA